MGTNQVVQKQGGAQTSMSEAVVMSRIDKANFLKKYSPPVSVESDQMYRHFKRKALEKKNLYGQ